MLPALLLAGFAGSWSPPSLPPASWALFRRGPGAAPAPSADLRVRLRPVGAPDPDGPSTDRGLTAAAEELVAGATRADARLSPGAVRLALGRAGYPGDARFLSVLGGAEPPPELTAALPKGEPIDVGWAWRELPGGQRFWVLGWAPRRVSLDPLPRDLPLDAGVAVRVDGARDPRLFVGQPDGGVVELALKPGLARWVDLFHVPGEYRLEVVDGDRVELLFSLYVDSPPPPPAPLPGPAPVADVAGATRFALDALAALRHRTGLPALQPFPAYERYVVEHANCVAQLGQVVHSSPSCPGVAETTYRFFQPHARHHEDVAAGATPEEAWERLVDSPGHRLNLLCRTCTHVEVGAAVPPGAPDRVVVVWELLEFPDGPPRPVFSPR